VFFLFLFSQGGQLVGLMPVLAACHLINTCSIVLHYIAIHVVANKVLSLSLFSYRPTVVLLFAENATTFAFVSSFLKVGAPLAMFVWPQAQTWCRAPFVILVQFCVGL